MFSNISDASGFRISPGRTDEGLPAQGPARGPAQASARSSPHSPNPGMAMSLAVGLLLLAAPLAPEGAAAQAPTSGGVGTASAASGEAPAGLQRQKFSGPRFGFTAFTGDVATQRSHAELEPIMTQFGWQFETRIVSLSNGGQALMEWVALVGGVEQSELNLSLAWLTGYRLASGVEFGVGPNVSYNRDSARTTTSMMVAGGATLPFGEIQVPLNLAVGIAEGGPRFTVLMGWIIG